MSDTHSFTSFLVVGISKVYSAPFSFRRFLNNFHLMLKSGVLIPLTSIIQSNPTKSGVYVIALIFLDDSTNFFSRLSYDLPS